MNAESIANALDRSRRSGSGWVAPCPAHDDRNPSLSINDGRDGKVLVKCFAGCDQRAIIGALRDLGLWPERESQKLGPIIAEYEYRDSRGQLLYKVTRHEPKDFRPWILDGRGGWIMRKHPTQVLYRLGEVLDSPIVFLVEGERDVETMRSHGFTATTVAGGAEAPWLPQFTEALSGREVVIVPDNDPAGWKRAKVAARSLLGHAARIIVFDLPPNTKDISDWFAAGHTETELIAQLESVHAS